MELAVSQSTHIYTHIIHTSLSHKHHQHTHNPKTTKTPGAAESTPPEKRRRIPKMGLVKMLLRKHFKSSLNWQRNVCAYLRLNFGTESPDIPFWKKKTIHTYRLMYIGMYTDETSLEKSVYI
jgi:hypothetical protein